MRASVAMMPRSVSSVGDRLDELADGPRRQRVEEVGVTGEGAHVVPRTQRFEHRREDPLGHAGHARVEVGPPGIRVVTAGQRPEGGTGRGGVAVVDEQPAVGVRRHRRVRGEPPPDEPQVEVEVGEDLARQQRHEVGVAREAGVDALERAGRHGRAAHPVRPLEDEHVPPRSGEVGGGREAVVTGPDDDVVVAHEVTLGDRARATPDDLTTASPRAHRGPRPPRRPDGPSRAGRRRRCSRGCSGRPRRGPRRRGPRGS